MRLKFLFQRVSLEEVSSIKTDNPLTIGQLKKWCDDNNISDDTPIGIYMGASERGDIAFGVIVIVKIFIIYLKK